MCVCVRVYIYIYIALMGQQWKASSENYPRKYESQSANVSGQHTVSATLHSAITVTPVLTQFTCKSNVQMFWVLKNEQAVESFSITTTDIL
jgi:hypothetical protein